MHSLGKEYLFALMLELVDKTDLKSVAEKRGGSIPPRGTTVKGFNMDFSILQQCTIVELVQELRNRLQTDAAVMVGTQELGSLCNLIECILIDRFNQSYPEI